MGRVRFPVAPLMKVTLDETGIALADVAMQSYVEHKLSNNSDIHVSNAVTIDVLRARLLEMDESIRPEITWIFFGKEVKFDKHLRSHDAWKDPRATIHDDALNRIIAPRKSRLV